MRSITDEELNVILKKHKEWFEPEGHRGVRADLSSADLGGVNLSNAYLRRANLRGANLMCANLKGANLYNANLRSANLMCADLKGANLYNANLRGANLHNANLQGADLQVANLMYANLQGADLRGANLDFSCWPLHCGSTKVIADDRLVAQMILHLTRLDTSQCSVEVRGAMDHIRKMSITNLFCKYRGDVDPLK
jgi:hypothetical protein